MYMTVCFDWVMHTCDRMIFTTFYADDVLGHIQDSTVEGGSCFVDVSAPLQEQVGS